MNAATKPAKTPRPLTPDQRSDLHAFWLACGRSLAGDCAIARPVPFLKRGLVARSGAPGRFALTDAGREIASAEDAARAERAEIRRANRGHNAMIGGAT